MKPALPFILQPLNRAIGDGLSSQTLLAGITVLTHAAAPLFQNVNRTPAGGPRVAGGRVSGAQVSHREEHSVTCMQRGDRCWPTAPALPWHSWAQALQSLWGEVRAGLAGDEGEGLIGEAQGHCLLQVNGVGSLGRLFFLGSHHQVQPHSLAPSTWDGGAPPPQQPQLSSAHTVCWASPAPTHRHVLGNGRTCFNPPTGR